MNTSARYAGHEALDPFFEVIQEGLSALGGRESFAVSGA
jgi:hypothetical protein